MKFSIIVPVYNAENFLDECILSILGQSYENWELILVNDDSTDRSFEICNKYAALDSRIKVISQKNSGPLIARVNGIKYSIGDYIGFLDSDDFIDSNMLEEISNIASYYMPDMILFNMKRVNANGKLLSINKHIYSTKDNLMAIDRNKLLRDFLSTNSLNNVCSKIIKRDIVFKDNTNYDQFYKLIQSEDKLLSLPWIYYSKSILYIDKPYYNYRLNPKGITHNFKYKNLIDIQKVHSFIIDFLINHNVSTNILTLAYNSSIYYILGGYLRYVNFNKLKYSEKINALKEINENETFLQAHQYVQGKNLFIYYLLKNKKILLLDIIAYFNKLRLRKLGHG